MKLLAAAVVVIVIGLLAAAALIATTRPANECLAQGDVPIQIDNKIRCVDR